MQARNVVIIQGAAVDVVLVSCHWVLCKDEASIVFEGVEPVQQLACARVLCGITRPAELAVVS